MNARAWATGGADETADQDGARLNEAVSAVGVDASVVIPTRNRASDLGRCLAALARQETRRSIEVIVVDDGSSPGPGVNDLALCPGTLLISSSRRGPAGARNLGWRAAQGEVVLFTDDDTRPGPGWVEAACHFLDAHPDHVGVEGPTESPTFDYLYQHSVHNDRAGAYWTCNVAYRRAALLEVGGFCEQFPWPHCEDRDLGFRMLEVGPIGFASGMKVLHSPRTLSLVALIRRARFVSSELLLHTRHPERYIGRRLWPHRLRPFVGVVRTWRERLRSEGWALLRGPRRFARFVAAAVGQIGVSLITVFLRRVPRADRGSA